MQVTVGVDVSAYVTVSAAGDDVSPENLRRIAEGAQYSEIFKVDWDTASSLRVICVADETEGVLAEDMPIEPCYYDAGQLLHSFLKGFISLDAMEREGQRLLCMDPAP